MELKLICTGGDPDSDTHHNARVLARFVNVTLMGKNVWGLWEEKGEESDVLVERTENGHRVMSWDDVQSEAEPGRYALKMPDSAGPLHERWARKCPKCGRNYERRTVSLYAALSRAADLGLSRLDLSKLG